MFFFLCLFSSSCFDFVFCCLKLMSNLCCWQWLSSGNGKTNPLFVSTIKQQQRRHSNMKNTNAHLFTHSDTHTCIYSWSRHRHNYQYYIGNKRKRTNKQKIHGEKNKIRKNYNFIDIRPRKHLFDSNNSNIHS